MKKKLVFTCAVMDMLHEGHINLLKKMRKEADFAVVFLHDDKSVFENKKRFPVQDFEHRKRNIEAIELTDVIIKIQNADPTMDIAKFVYLTKKVISEFIYMRGDDWKDFPGKKIMKAFNIPIKFIKYTDGISSTKLRNQIK